MSSWKEQVSHYASIEIRIAILSVKLYLVAFKYCFSNCFLWGKTCLCEGNLFTSLVCPLRGACEKPLDRSGRICNGRASSVSGVVPCCGPHLDHRIHFCLPADDHSWSCCYLLLHQVNPHSDGSLLASLLPCFRFEVTIICLVSEGINHSCQLLPSSHL